MKNAALTQQGLVQFVNEQLATLLPNLKCTHLVITGKGKNAFVALRLSEIVATPLNSIMYRGGYHGKFSDLQKKVKLGGTLTMTVEEKQMVGYKTQTITIDAK